MNQEKPNSPIDSDQTNIGGQYLLESTEFDY
jgi:hypothetical protein